jgi:outer membrane protein assembly factor BamB
MGHGNNNGLPVCVELKTGRAMWGPLRGPGRESAAVLYADGNLYFRYQNGVMALIEATPEEYRLKGTFDIATHHADSWPHPVIAHGRLYLRDQQDLHVYDIRAK